MTTTTLPAILRNAAASLRYARLQRERERREERDDVCRETLERGRDCLAEQERAEEVPAP